jgi:hypothetical protein
MDEEEKKQTEMWLAEIFGLHPKVFGSFRKKTEDNPVKDEVLVNLEELQAMHEENEKDKKRNEDYYSGMLERTMRNYLDAKEERLIITNKLNALKEQLRTLCEDSE